MDLDDDSALLAYRQNLRSYYAPETGKRDVAKEAYDAARAFVKTELHGSQLEEILELEQYTTVEDVRAIVEQAKARYEKCSQGRKGILKYLTKFSARIMYFGQVLDTLAQHHPEYVALAWGSLKFVFMGILNYGRLISEFSRALARISDALCQTKLAAELFQTDPVKDAISQLYANIMLFFQQSMRWYNRSSVGRGFSAILKPYELEYEDIVEQIKLCAKAINDIASAASRAEVRDMHITIQLIRQDMQKRDQKLVEMQLQAKNAQKSRLQLAELVTQSIQVATNHKIITERIDVNVLDIMPRLRDLQYSDILQALKPSNCPRQTLNKLHVLNNRSKSRRLPTTEPKEVLRSLNAWFLREGSSLFVLRVSPRAEAKAIEITTDIISLLIEKHVNIIWRFSPLISNENSEPPSITDMIRMLVFQAVQLDPRILHTSSNNLNVEKFTSTHTEAEWMSLLTKLVANLPQCYIIIESQDLFRQARSNSKWVASFLHIFATLAIHAKSNGNSLKFLVLCYGGGKNLQTNSDQTDCFVSTLRRPLPIPKRLRHTVSHKKRGTGWQAVQPKF